MLAARANGTTPKVAGGDWLSRALARAGVMPTKDAERAIVQGRVRVNRAVVREPFRVLRTGDQVFVDGRRVDCSPRTLVLMLHKPPGVVTAGSDPRGGGTVFEVLRARLTPELGKFGWHAVGRLDRNTTGLLLFTNDERLVAHVTSPTTHLQKRYVAQVASEPTAERLAPLERGIALHDGPTRPARVELLGERVVGLTLTEGRHHQVKRMLGAVGLPVLKLHRDRIGGLKLDVPESAWRVLRDEEVREGLRYRRTSGGPPGAATDSS